MRSATGASFHLDNRLRRASKPTSTASHSPSLLALWGIGRSPRKYHEYQKELIFTWRSPEDPRKPAFSIGTSCAFAYSQKTHEGLQGQGYIRLFPTGYRDLALRGCIGDQNRQVLSQVAVGACAKPRRHHGCSSILTAACCTQHGYFDDLWRLLLRSCDMFSCL